MRGWRQDKCGYRLVTCTSWKCSSKCMPYGWPVILGSWAYGGVMALITSLVLCGRKWIKWRPRKLEEGKRGIGRLHRLSKAPWCCSSSVWLAAGCKVLLGTTAVIKETVAWARGGGGGVGSAYLWCLFMSLFFAIYSYNESQNSLYMFKKYRWEGKSWIQSQRFHLKIIYGASLMTRF